MLTAVAMQASLPQIGFGSLLRLAAVFILLNFSVKPAWAASEMRQEQTADYTIAFSSLAPWDVDVFIADADGSNPRPLASHPDLDYNAAFSPNGQWIVFTSRRNGSADLYRIHPDGSGLQRLTNHPAFDDAAAFSPEGQRIAFVSSRSGQADIWVLELENGKTWNVTSSPGGDFRPAWSLDGKWICFASAQGGLRDEHPLTGNPQPYGDLYLMRPDGSEVQALTDDQCEDGTPSWVRRPPLPPVH